MSMTTAHTLELVFTLQRKIDQAGQQPRRDIVDAEKADVLQGRWPP